MAAESVGVADVKVFASGADGADSEVTDGDCAARQ
jgi:hypothetical protein